MGGDQAWAAALRAACERPDETAAAWRAAGGQVAGLLGWSAPRELVAAAGLLPVRLSPGRLASLPGRGSGGVPGPASIGEPRSPGEPGSADERRRLGAPGGAGRAGSAGRPAWPDAGAAFGRELSPGTARIAAALLSGALDWIDFLVIGRDREDYTRLFYVLRELRRSGAAPGLIPVAFFDLLRLPSRTSARYNRQRAAELTAVIAGWAGRPVTPADLTGAVEAAGVIAHSFRGIQALRARPQPAITGTDALAAAIAARVLPAGRLRPLLDAALAAGAPDAADRPVLHRAFPERTGPERTVSVRTGPAARGGSGMSRADAHDIPEISSYGGAGRVFLAGSGVDDLTVYQALEGLGLAIVGEDHEWGDDGSEYPLATRDPLDGIVDRYQFAHGAAARAGLRDRVGRTADRVRAAGADSVLYLLGPHDEAAGWELPALREHLGAGIPLVPVRLRDPAQCDPAQQDQGPAGDGAHPELREAGRRLLDEIGAAGAAGGARETGHG